MQAVMRREWLSLGSPVRAAVLVMACASALARSSEAQLAPGDILVADFEAGASGGGALFRVERTTGARTLLSDFENPAQGPLGQSPFDVVARDGSTIYVMDNQGGSGAGTLFLVDAAGMRTILSDFGNPAQGPTGLDPIGIAIGLTGLLVADKDAGTNGQGALFLVDATTGVRTILSDFGNAGQGPVGGTPFGVARHSAFVPARTRRHRL